MNEIDEIIEFIKSTVGVINDVEECDDFPYYGVAPHECYWRKPGGFEGNKLGTSTVNPLENWPDNFLAEINPNVDIKSQLSYGLCGIYYCPACKRGMVETETLLSKNTIQSKIDLLEK